MDPSNPSLTDGPEAVHLNGVHKELSNAANNGVVSNVDPVVTQTIETVAPSGSFENFNLLDSTATDNLSVAESKEGPNEKIDGNNVTISKEEELELIDETEQSRTQKGPVKNKDAKSPSLRGAHTSLVKKNKAGKDEKAASSVSNGTSASDTHPRQQIKNRSSNDKQTRLSKHPGKSDAASSEAPMEKGRPRLLKKEPINSLQGKAESSSPTAEDAKPRKVGTMPNYGFSFRCNERAERRKEFYSQLEERIHAKEMEESNLQAKTKESQEAELKKLRKSLKFKATPMPTFYQEPAPPRVELKKIPTTRAKSPKLGRRKSSTSSQPDGNTNSGAQLGRLSLDEKVTQNNPTKGIIPVHQKKPQRRSLPPRLTSEGISSSNSSIARTLSKAVNDEKTSPSSVLSNATGEEKVEITAAVTEENNALSTETSETPPLNAEPGEAEPHVNGDIVTENKPQLTLVQKPIAAEH